MATSTPMFPVQSSQISHIGYDKEEFVLYVTFKNGSTYKYENVPQHVFNELMGASSVGKFFASNIKNGYTNFKIS